MGTWVWWYIAAEYQYDGLVIHTAHSAHFYDTEEEARGAMAMSVVKTRAKGYVVDVDQMHAAKMEPRTKETSNDSHHENDPRGDPRPVQQATAESDARAG